MIVEVDTQSLEEPAVRQKRTTNDITHARPRARESNCSNLLQGVRVLDMAGPLGMYCTKILGLMGADVVKVEPPGGDPTRKTAPFYEDVPNDDRSLPWFYLNTDKRSITLNIETASGKWLLERLVNRFDILVETFSPDYLSSHNLGYQHLSAINPALIHAAITPYGQSGPYAGYKGSDLTGQAMGGLIYPTGWPDTPPLQWPGWQANYLASMHALPGILIALLDRDSCGEGQFIDVSMHESIPFALQNIGSAMYHGAKQVVGRQGSNPRVGAYPTEPGCGIFACKDGYVYVSWQDRSWRALVAWMEEYGSAGELNDPKWTDKQERSKHYAVIDKAVAEFVSQLTKHELVSRAQDLRMWFLPVNTMTDVANDTHLRAVGFYAPVSVPAWGTIIDVPGAPWREMGQEGPRPQRAPGPGEHNMEIYRDELGLNVDEIVALAAGGVI